MAEEEDDSLDALEYELNQMGLSVEDLQPPEDGQYDRRAMARVESARIMSRRFIERDRVKDRISAQTKVGHFKWVNTCFAVTHEVRSLKNKRADAMFLYDSTAVYRLVEGPCAVRCCARMFLLAELGV